MNEQEQGLSRLSPEEYIKLLLRERIELEIKEKKLQERLDEVEKELIASYVKQFQTKSNFICSDTFVQYEETLYRFSFDDSLPISLTVTLVSSLPSYIRV